MGLSSDLISQFVKATNDDKKSKKEKSVYGTVVEKSGSFFVKLDGADDKEQNSLIPISSKSVHVANGNRVTVMIKNHSAVVTGNLATPAVRSERDVQLDSIPDDLHVKNLITETLEAGYLTAEVIRSTYVTSETLSTYYMTANEIRTNYIDTEKFEAVQGVIDELDTTYANIDFSNIGKAAMEHLYSESGLIKDVTIGNGVITGELIGVTISGDLIKADTLVAEKLVLKGEDGLYYRLNTDGETVENEQTDYNSLNGEIIIAKSIAASKINVQDLQAFGATIGGFNLSTSSIYSGVKESINNTTRGIYVGSDGQVAFGDESKFIKYYKDSDGTYKVNIAADSVTFNTSNRKIGGTNILRGTGSPSSLGMSASWSKGTWRTAGGGTTGGRTIIDIADAPNPHIKKGFRIEGDNSDRATAQDSIPVTEGVTYTMSCYARGTGSLRLQVGNSPYSSGSHNLDGVTTWTKYSYTFVAGTGNGITNGVTNVYFTNRGTGVLELCGFKLEVGTDATDWNPSPYVDYLNFDSTGLVIGDLTGTSLGSNVLIDTDSVDIRKGESVRASFGEDYLYLAKHSRNAKIDLCNGLVELYHQSKYSYDTLFVIDTPNATEIMGTYNPLYITSTVTGKVAIQFSNVDGTLGSIGMVESASGAMITRNVPSTDSTYTVLDTGNYYTMMDSGWLTCMINTSGEFTIYDNNSNIRYRKIGKMVEVAGAVKPKTDLSAGTTNYTFATLPTGFRPSLAISERSQGSNGHSWLFSITTGGELRYSRYSDGSSCVDLPAATWLPFHATFFTD